METAIWVRERNPKFLLSPQDRQGKEAELPCYRDTQQSAR